MRESANTLINFKTTKIMSSKPQPNHKNKRWNIFCMIVLLLHILEILLKVSVFTQQKLYTERQRKTKMY